MTDQAFSTSQRGGCNNQVVVLMVCCKTEYYCSWKNLNNAIVLSPLCYRALVMICMLNLAFIFWERNYSFIPVGARRFHWQIFSHLDNRDRTQLPLSKTTISSFFTAICPISACWSFGCHLMMLQGEARLFGCLV